MLAASLYVGMMSATASLGLILLWDVDGGLTQIDKFLYSAEDYIKVSFDSLSFLVMYIIPSFYEVHL